MGSRPFPLRPAEPASAPSGRARLPSHNRVVRPADLALRFFPLLLILSPVSGCRLIPKNGQGSLVLQSRSRAV